LQYQAAVRALTEFTAKQGDLDNRFTPSPSAQEGMAGHALIASRRGAGYLTEIALSGEYHELRIRGRADGYDPQCNQLEEFKTHRGDVALIPENHRQLHWAQLRMYGHLLCQKKALHELTLGLVYFDILSQRETVLQEQHTAASLEACFESHSERFLEWARLELAHRSARNEALDTLRFPHSALHAGQRQLAEAVYRITNKGGTLLAQAPTGLGKTLGTLFPVLKAVRARELDKVFFLVAKTSGRRMALDALRSIQGDAPAVPIRVLELVAREKACEYPGKACHGMACPLASGFYDRLAQARAAAVTRNFLDQSTVRAVALEHGVCPYYLSQELVRWCDVIVADYNYYFDSSAALYHLTLANQWKIALLVDEAHNLVERGRTMYTASLHEAHLQAARRALPLENFSRHWTRLFAAQETPYEAFDSVPSAFLQNVQSTVTACTTLLTENPLVTDEAALRFYFDLIQFARLAENMEKDCVFDVTKPSEATIRNLVPARFLKERFAAAAATVLFSATLAPADFYRNMLGLPADSRWLDVDSPFTADQLTVHIVDGVSTRYRHRERSLPAIVALLATQYAQVPGNYLAFFSSYEYLDRVWHALVARHPHIPAWKQQRNMSEAEREAFLQRFTPTGQGIGLAVLGGAFAEGIDLPGERLIGAFIATLGLPQINPINREMEARIGYEYTYLYPGLRKAVQAAGRVIRSPTDRGVIYLIDDRYALPEIQALLPRWWKLQH
jgi:DNA excision repair protein ERCC-2